MNLVYEALNVLKIDPGHDTVILDVEDKKNSNLTY